MNAQDKARQVGESIVTCLSTACKDFAGKMTRLIAHYQTTQHGPGLIPVPLPFYCPPSHVQKLGSGPMLRRINASTQRYPGARMLQIAGNPYLKLITPNRPLAYWFGPAVKNSWFGLPFCPPPWPKANAQSSSMLMTLPFVSLS